ncbi:MAG: LCP family protein [Acidobacteria bacterium]|nr:LCP family protein [Acidobacteriota bacterium]
MDKDHFSRLDPDAAQRLDPPPPEAEEPRRLRALEWLLFAVFGFMFLLGGFALYTSVAPGWNAIPDSLAEGLENDRVNILLLGVGGEEHPGGGKDLADTILVASLRPSTKEAAIISIPRDLYVRIDRYGTHRINRAHQIGQQSGYPGGGPALAMATVEEVTGLPLHAYVRVDFGGFEKIIDSLGGVEIDVEQGFYDYLFDDRFEPGLQTMDGERALRFARYRYIRSELGTNFSREQRQQKVIQAVKEKVREQVSNDPVQMMKLARTLSTHTDTNLSIKQLVNLYRTFGFVSPESIKSVSLEPVTEVFEVRSIAGAGEAVRPKSGDFREIRAVARNVFDQSSPNVELTARRMSNGS